MQLAGLSEYLEPNTFINYLRTPVGKAELKISKRIYLLNPICKKFSYLIPFSLFALPKQKSLPLELFVFFLAAVL